MANVSLSAPAPLDAQALRRVLTGPGRTWTQVVVVEQTGSTNADLLDAARRGGPLGRPGTVLAAEDQTAGRGRADRVWVSPPRSGIAVSVLLEPTPVPGPRWGWLPLLVGLATAEAIEGTTGVATSLKWPNDLLVDGRKLGGILAQRVELTGSQTPGVVVGLGLNVDLPAPALPTPQATSLLVAGAAHRDRTRLLGDILVRLESWYEAWVTSAGDATGAGLADAYRQRCATIGSPVAVTLPNGRMDGQATGVDDDGALLVRAGDGSVRTVTAGDVVHVRAGGAG